MSKKSKAPTVTWTPNPAEHDYPAAESFLRLIAPLDLIAVCIRLPSEAPTVHQHAKDILRAAGLPLLPVDDPEVARDLKNVSKGVGLSPILLIGGDLSTGRPLSDRRRLSPGVRQLPRQREHRHPMPTGTAARTRNSLIPLEDLPHL